jgi:hypothetical protein
VGAALTGVGLYWMSGSGQPNPWAGLFVALPVGWLKARYVLVPRARSNSSRILAAGDGRCPGGVFSWSTWVLVLGLMAVGGVLRSSPLPRYWLGVLYTAIGSALLGGSAVAWRAWRDHRATHRRVDRDRRPRA